jgi:DNA-binding IclR family transcriptional regulator
VENALALLEVLSEEGGDFSLSHLSDRLGIKKASVFRLLATFESRGYVERRQGSRKYRLGLAAYEIGQKFLSRMDLLSKARPVMEQLARECSEDVYLVVRHQEEALFLDMVPGLQKVKIVSLVARRFPLATAAAGKVFLAFGNGNGTGATGASREAPEDAAAATFATIRQGGCWVGQHDGEEGIDCAAVPLFDDSRSLAGVLAIVGPGFRLSREKLDGQILPVLRAAGLTISSKLGYLEPYLGHGGRSGPGGN